MTRQKLRTRSRRPQSKQPQKRSVRRESAKSPNQSSGGDRAAYTVRLNPVLATKFDKLRAGRKFAVVAEEAVKLWMEKERGEGGRAGAMELRESLTETLVFAVLRELRENTSWAKNAIQSASLLDPFVSIYVERVSHFREEKLALAKNFVPWFVNRALNYAETRDVVIVADAGTTIKSVLDELGPSFERKWANLRTLQPSQIQIITNNFPGAESYQAFADKLNHRGPSLAEIVPCHLVPGVAFREYSAIVGPKAEQYVQQSCVKSGKARPLICLGLVASNWVLLEGQPIRPTLLARGALHRRFKEAVIEACDETFLVSPLCKMVRMDRRSDTEALQEFNDDFVDEVRAQKREYERARPPSPIDPDRLKVVTTARTVSQSIVYTHSSTVCGSLGALHRPNYDAETNIPIEDVPHLVYPHDAASNATFDEQLRIELPHERTRAREFRKKYFDIGLPRPFHIGEG